MREGGPKASWVCRTVNEFGRPLAVAEYAACVLLSMPSLFGATFPALPVTADAISSASIGVLVAGASPIRTILSIRVHRVGFARQEASMEIPEFAFGTFSAVLRKSDAAGKTIGEAIALGQPFPAVKLRIQSEPLSLVECLPSKYCVRCSAIYVVLNEACGATDMHGRVVPLGKVLDAFSERQWGRIGVAMLLSRFYGHPETYISILRRVALFEEFQGVRVVDATRGHSTLADVVLHGFGWLDEVFRAWGFTETRHFSEIDRLASAIERATPSDARNAILRGVERSRGLLYVYGSTPDTALLSKLLAEMPDTNVMEKRVAGSLELRGVLDALRDAELGWP